MNPEECYGPIPIDTDSELTEIAAESGMSLQELKEFLKVNRLGVFRPGSVPIAEEVKTTDKLSCCSGQWPAVDIKGRILPIEPTDTSTTTSPGPSHDPAEGDHHQQPVKESGQG